jgi:hypothetical protein
MAGFADSGPAVRVWESGDAHCMAARKQRGRGREREGERNRSGVAYTLQRPSVTHFLQPDLSSYFHHLPIPLIKNPSTA